MLLFIPNHILRWDELSIAYTPFKNLDQNDCIENLSIFIVSDLFLCSTDELHLTEKLLTENTADVGRQIMVTKNANCDMKPVSLGQSDKWGFTVH